MWFLQLNMNHHGLIQQCIIFKLPVRVSRYAAQVYKHYSLFSCQKYLDLKGIDGFVCHVSYICFDFKPQLQKYRPSSITDRSVMGYYPHLRTQDCDQFAGIASALAAACCHVCFGPKPCTGDTRTGSGSPRIG